MIDLTTKTPIGDEPEPQAPCIFCGRVIGHINDCKERGDNCVGYFAGAVVNGEIHHFLYCNDPICPERQAAEDVEQGITNCSCEGYRAYDVVVGYACQVCGKLPCEPGTAQALDQKGEEGQQVTPDLFHWVKPADLTNASWSPEKPKSPPRCLWCEGPLLLPNGAPVDGLITVDGLEVDGEVHSTEYCSGDCLFHWLLSEWTDEATFSKVQELINLLR